MIVFQVILVIEGKRSERRKIRMYAGITMIE